AGKVLALNESRPPVVEPGLDSLVAVAVASGALRATESVRDGLGSADLSLVCVGTPSAGNGSTDLVQVRRVIGEIGAALADSDRPHTVVIRSTVPPGTVEEIIIPLLESSSGRKVGPDLQVSMCPEFLREGSSVADFFAPPFLVIGGTPESTAAVHELFGFLDCSVHIVPIRAAESIKYACNAFHALKVSFTNELSRLYRLLGVDARDVMDVFVADHQLNISSAYFRPGFAFGGSCLPKDLRSLLHLARMNSVDLPVLQGALVSNEMLVRDLADRVLRSVEQHDITNRRVALLGLSFKQQTDDLRESPHVALAEILIGKGIDVSIHDPVVNPAQLTGANLQYVQSRLPHLQRVLHDAASHALEGAQVAVVSTAHPQVVRAVVQARPRVVYDLHGRLGADIEALDGYQGVGW
ncbi:MAG: nucleotide sugar dehydrogenase, partial [Actinomycetota bacterium]|nr:nucleotide sugar dehydrogenase [Actinomycetota bacterium]